MPLVTRTGVELARVGQWDTSTGKWNCTRAQLADAVRAQDSGRFRNGVIKPGHTDPRFDGEPALGQIRNLRLAEEGESLVGDLLIPDWLDEEMPAVYPSRSVEADLGVETVDGERFGMVVTAISLLGVTKPAIQSLADLEQRFMPVAASEYVAALSVAAAFFDPEKHPRGAKGTSTGGQFAVGSGSGYSSKGKGGEAGNVKQVQAELVRLGFLGAKDGKDGNGVDGLFGPKTTAAMKAFQKAHHLPATGKVDAALLKALKAEGKKPAERVKAAADVAASTCNIPDLFCREILTDEVVFVNASGQVWTAPWSELAGDVTVGTPQPAAVTYTPMADTIAARAAHAMQMPLHCDLGLGSQQATAALGASSVDITPEMRETLGVDENADEAAVLAALKSLKTPPVVSPAPALEAPTGDNPVIPAVPEIHDHAQPVGVVVETPDVEALVAAKVAAALAPMEATISGLSGQLAARNATEAAETKQRVISAAAQDGKFLPADRAQWEKDYDEAPAVTTRILASLKPGTALPIAATGYAGTGEGGPGDEADQILREMGWVS